MTDKDKDPMEPGYWILPPEIYDYMVEKYGHTFGRKVYIDNQRNFYDPEDPHENGRIDHPNCRSWGINDGLPDDAENVLEELSEDELEKLSEKLEEAAKEIIPTDPEDVFAGIDPASGSDETVEHREVLEIDVELLEIPKWEGGQDGG